MSDITLLNDLDCLLRNDLMTFTEMVFAELSPQATLSVQPHLEVMAAKLAACLSGRGPKRLIVNLPPRSLKSITASVAAVAWLLGKDPSKQIICASYGQDLADKHARDTRKIMMSPFYKRVFPETMLSQKQSVNDFMTTQNGGRMATSVGGVLSGRGADLVGHVLDRGEDWEVISFPAIAEVDEKYTVETPLGPLVYERRVGDVLDPERESLQTLQNIKLVSGAYNFASQYQQNPAPLGGVMVKTGWLRYYDPEGLMPAFTFVLQSWDTANKSGELNDFQCVHHLGSLR